MTSRQSFTRRFLVRSHHSVAIQKCRVAQQILAKIWILEKVCGLPDAVITGCTRESSKVVMDAPFVIIYNQSGYRIWKLPTTAVWGVLTLGLSIKRKQGAVNDCNAV
jgi:hypothetical protein